MEIKQFVKWIRSHDAKKVLVTSHENVDPDGLCAAVAIAKWFESIWSCDTTLSFDSLNRISETLASEFDIAVHPPSNGTQFDLVCVVDMSSITQIGKVEEMVSQGTPLKICLDHHHIAEADRTYFDVALIDTDVSSTTELLTKVFLKDRYKPEQSTATLLMIGLLYDSRRFLNSGSSVFAIVNTLLAWGANYEQALSTLQSKMPRSEVIARIKAAQRIRRVEINGWIVVTSEISSFEASACRALIDLGADIAVVYSDKAEDVRFSIRSRKEVYEKTGLNLAEDVMIPLGEVIGGSGGGHAIAAGANGSRNGHQGMKRVMELLQKKLVSSREES